MKILKIKSKEGESGGYNFDTELMTILLTFSFLTVLVPTIFFYFPPRQSDFGKDGTKYFAAGYNIAM